MSRLVMKFGGTSVADAARIAHAAKHVRREVRAGNEVIVVVSAMGGETNRLVALCREISPRHDTREYDVVVTAGEQITSGLMAMALQNLDVEARSWLGWQIPIQTDDMHGSARIINIGRDNLEAQFNEGRVIVVPGFQGISPKARVSSLGRGGSDATAVALAAAIDADRCDIYTDVDGVYTADPRIVPRAQRLARASYEEMLEMASLGARVLQTSSVELSMLHRVKLQVRSSFDDPEQSDTISTLICSEEEIMEYTNVTSIAYARDEAKITLRNVPDLPGAAARIFGPLANTGVNVDMIVQNIAASGAATDVTFTLNNEDVPRALKIIEQTQADIGFDSVDHTDTMVKISIVGVGMRSHAGVAQKMFQILGEEGINIYVISTSEIKISVLIDANYLELAMRALHAGFGLDDAK